MVGMGSTTKGWAGLAAILLFICLMAALFVGIAPAPMVAAAGAQYLTATQNIRNAPGGGDCQNIGVWDSGTKSCTINNDLSFASAAGIEIVSDGVTLNGNGHAMTGAGDGAADGVYLSGRSGVTVENITVGGFNSGISLDASHNNVISQNHTTNNVVGVNLNASDSNELAGNDSSGDAVGINLNNSGYNTLSANAVQNATAGDGVSLEGSSNNTLTGNSSDMNAGNGFCIDPGNNNNQFIDNSASNNAGNGFWLNQSDGNTIRGNTTVDNNAAMNGSMNMVGLGEISINDSNNNVVYQNSFVSSSQPQASVTGGAGNIFNLPAPAGGNYWSSWTTPDANGDGFVDSPYVFMGGQDNLPWAVPNGWSCAKTTLGLSSPSPYWASYADYTAGQLTVGWTVTNTGAGTAFGVSVDGSADTNGVSVLGGELPKSLGTLGAGGSDSFTIRYSIPQGVTNWRSALTGSAQDSCGAVYAYP